MSTKYSLQIQNVTGGEFADADFTRSTKATVIAEGDSRRKSDKVGYRVVTDKGTVVAEASVPKQRVITVHTPAFTKVIDLPEDLQKLVPEGYAAAYRRSRNGAIVLRREVDLEDDEARYLVISEAKGARVGGAPTTRAAGALMKGLKAGLPV